MRYFYSLKYQHRVHTGWLTLCSTRNMNTASASREKGLESVPAHSATVNENSSVKCGGRVTKITVSSKGIYDVNRHNTLYQHNICNRINIQQNFEHKLLNAMKNHYWKRQ